MPKGPQGQMRPTDAIGCAVLVGKIATGEAEDDIILPEIRGRKGGEARSRALDPARRNSIAKQAAASRWQTGKGSQMMTTERQKLAERFQEMKAQGLTDMKFHLGRVSEATTEAVCAEVNKLLDNINSGKVQRLDSWGDSRRVEAKA